jgi:hypothetical protein
MSFSLKNYDVSADQGNLISKYVNYNDGPIDLKINSITFKESSTGSLIPIFNMETRPITDTKFTPLDGYTGKACRVSGVSFYLKTEDQQQKFCQKMGKIAVACGCFEAMQQIEANTFKEWMSQAEALLKGKFARYTFGAKEYTNNTTGKMGWELFFNDYIFVENCDVPNTLPKIDLADPKWYKKDAKAETVTSFGNTAKTDDLPF